MCPLSVLCEMCLSLWVISCYLFLTTACYNFCVFAFPYSLPPPHCPKQASLCLLVVVGWFCGALCIPPTRPLPADIYANFHQFNSSNAPSTDSWLLLGERERGFPSCSMEMAALASRTQCIWSELMLIYLTTPLHPEYPNEM